MSTLSAKEYADQKINPLFSPLFKELLSDRPENIVDYVMSWFRTNGTSAAEGKLRSGSSAPRGSSGLVVPSSQFKNNYRKSQDNLKLTVLSQNQSPRRASAYPQLTLDGVLPKHRFIDSDSEGPEIIPSLRNSASGNSIIRSAISGNSVDKNNASATTRVDRLLAPSMGQSSGMLKSLAVLSSAKSHEVLGVLEDEARLLTIFQQNPYLRLLNETESAEIKHHFNVMSVKKNQNLLNDSNRFEFYIVVYGALESYKCIPGSETEVIIRVHRECSTFFTDPQQAQRPQLRASASETVLLTIDQDTFNKYLKAKITERRHRILPAVSAVRAFSYLSDSQRLNVADNAIEKLATKEETIIQEVIELLTAANGYDPHIRCSERHLSDHAGRNRCWPSRGGK